MDTVRHPSVNFAAQIVYFYHLYYTSQHPLLDPKSALVMGSVLVLFLTSCILLVMKHKAGFYTTVFYLSLELIFHLRENDPILWMAFAIGYLSFFASGYFLVLLPYRRKGVA